MSLENITNNEIKRDSRLKNFFRAAVLSASMALGAILPSYGQTHDVNFKVRELTHGTGANIENVKVDLNDGEYIGFTNTQGEAVLHDVPQGTYSIKVSKPGFITFVQENYLLDSDKNFNASIPSKTRTIPAGTGTFIVDWYKGTFRTVGTLGQNKDPPHWKQINPINNRLAPGYSQSDSLLVVDAIKMIEDGTGYDLITLVPSSTSPDTTYTIELNSYTNTSYINFINYITFTGNSKITTTTEKKRIIHEIIRQIDMKPYFDPIPCPASVMDQDILTMTDPQWWDYNNITITQDQHHAKARGEQDLFLGNMQEYVAPGVPAQTTNTKPTNNASGLNKIVEIAWNKISGTNKYHVDIATDTAFSNMVKDLLVYRIDTLITLENGKTYFMRVRPENDAGNATWSSTTTFSTESIILPDQASLSSPLEGATKVVNPVQYNITSANATSFRVIAKNDLSQVLKDTIILVNNPTIPLPYGTDIFTQVFGINTNGTGPGSVIVHYTTIKADPTDASVTYPTNNQTKVTQPLTFTNGASLNAEQYRWRIRKHTTQELVLDTLLNTANGFTYDKLKPGEMYDVTVQPINSDVNGKESAANTFTIILDKPGLESTLTPTNNQTKVTQPFTYTNTSGTSSEEHRWQIRELDNTVKLDTIVKALQFMYDKLEPGKTYKVRVKGVNKDQEGDWSTDVIYTIIKGDLNSILITSPLNNATEVTSPVSVTSSTGGQYAEGYKYEIKTLDDVAVLDTATLGNSFNKKLPGNKTLKVRGWAYNSDKEGTKSPWVIFTTFDNPATIKTGIPNASSTVDPRLETTFEYEGADIDNDPMKFDIHLWSTGSTPSDTTIYDIVGQKYVLPPNKLKSKTTYFYTIKAKSGTKSTTSTMDTFNTITVGINDTEVLKGNMVIYPNPNPNYIKFHQDIQGVTDIDLINVSGQILRHVYNERQPPGDYLISIDKNGLASGFYLIRKTTEGTQKKQVETGKIIINE